MVASKIQERFTAKTRRGAALFKRNDFTEASLLHLAIVKGYDECVLMAIRAGGQQSFSLTAKLISIDQTFPGPRL